MSPFFVELVLYRFSSYNWMQRLVRSSFSHTEAAEAGSHRHPITSFCRNQILYELRSTTALQLHEVNVSSFIPFQVISLRSEKLCKACQDLFACVCVVFKAFHKNKALVEIRSNRSAIRKLLVMSFNPYYI